MEEQELYIVHMLKYGDRQKHSYIAGIFDSFEKAHEAGEEESIERCGKYEYEINILVLNLSYHQHKQIKIWNSIKKEYYSYDPL